MIIVRQDRKAIYNFNNVNCIDISKLGEKYYIRLFDNTYKGEGTGDCIGIYETEKRAKEVLQEIMEYYNSLTRKSVYAMGDDGFTFEEKFYYEMPEK